MKNSSKWIITALCLILLGAILAGIILFGSGCSYEGFKGEKVTQVSYTPEGEFDRIEVDVDISGVTFEVSQEGALRVECYESEHLKHDVTVENGALVIKQQKDSRKWYEKIFNLGVFNMDQYKVKVFLPGSEFSSLTVENDTGSVNVPDGFKFDSVRVGSDTGAVTIGAINAETLSLVMDTGAVKVKGAQVGSLDISTDTGVVNVSSVNAENVMIETDTGVVTVEDVACGAFTAESDTGAVKLVNVNVEGRLKVENDTGTIRFDKCSAGSIDASADTGSITGTLTSEMVFDAKSSTGSVKVPDSTTGGECRLRTSTGSIKIEYAGN